jgi:hypothetical protein
VRGRIAAELREVAQREAFESLVDGLKKRAKIHLKGGFPAGELLPTSPPGEKEVPQ